MSIQVHDVSTHFRSCGIPFSYPAFSWLLSTHELQAVRWIMNIPHNAFLQYDVYSLCWFSLSVSFFWLASVVSSEQGESEHQWQFGWPWFLHCSGQWNPLNALKNIASWNPLWKLQPHSCISSWQTSPLNLAPNKERAQLRQKGSLAQRRKPTRPSVKISGMSDLGERVLLYPGHHDFLLIILMDQSS